EDGIRDDLVTGVQTCALPISMRSVVLAREQHASELPQALPTRSSSHFSGSEVKAKLANVRLASADGWASEPAAERKRTKILAAEIGRASCREREEMGAADGAA